MEEINKEYVITQDKLDQINAMKKEGWEKKDPVLEGREVKIMKVRDLKFHEMANEHPKMSEKDFNSLMLSISEVGQLEPVVLYRKRMVDGRHRVWAVNQLGIENISYVELPNNLSLSDIRERVLATDTRRHKTSAQKSVQAYFDFIRNSKSDNMSQQYYAIKYGVGQASISRCGNIVKKLGTDILNEMLKKGVVQLPNGRYAKSINAIIKYISDIERISNKRERVSDIPESIQTAVDIVNGLYRNADSVGLAMLKSIVNDKIRKLATDDE